MQNNALKKINSISYANSQRKALLSAIGGIYPMDSMLAIFDMDKYKTPLSHQLAFQVHITSKGKGIH